MKYFMSEADYIWYINFERSVLKRQLEAFRNGNKYKSLRNEYEAVCRKKDAEILRLKKELADARKETTQVMNIWMQAADDTYNDCQKRLEQADKTIMEKQERIYEVERQRDQALDSAKEWRQKYYELSEKTEELSGKVTKLTAQVNKDFENSSIPSSQQGLRRKKIPNTREKTERKCGGQPGHAGHRLVQRQPDESYRLPDPQEYLENKDYFKSGEVIKRQKIIIEVTAKIVEYTPAVFRHKKTGSRVHAEFPKGYDTDILYDSSVKAFAYLLSNEGNMSCGKIRCLLREISHGTIDMSEGTINRLTKEFSDKSVKERESIISDLMKSPVTNVDFTNANVNGYTGQVLIMAAPETDAYIYMARDSKGHAGIKDTPLGNYVGTIVHDHDKTFYSYGMQHQECMQHNLRYLKGSQENEVNLEWNKKMYSLLCEMIHYKKNMNNEQDLDKIKGFEEKYDEIIELAKKEYEDEPPSDYYRDGYNLYLRLLQYKENQLLFLYDIRIPADNSLAERLARVFKRKQKQMMVVRSKENFEYLCNGLSIINTLRRRDTDNLYDTIIEIFDRPKQ